MKKLFGILALMGGLVLAVQGYGQMGMGRGGCMVNMSMIRHRYVMQNGIDPRYASRANPLPMTAQNIEAGRKLYGVYCASCHGTSGLGNGPAGKALNPPPPDIAAFSKMPMASDAYLYWTIAEGGVPLKTAMPASKGLLKPDQVWEIIVFLRNL